MTLTPGLVWAGPIGVDYLAGGGSDVEFAGWKSGAGLIAHLDIFDTSATIQNMFFKDLMSETPSSSPPGAAALELSSLVLFGIGSVAFALGWHHRRRGDRAAV